MATAVLSLHGIGDTPPDFDQELINGTNDMLARKYPKFYATHDPSHLAYYSVWYQPELQSSQDDLWDRLNSRYDLDYRKLREFVVYALGDAATYSTKKELANFPYERVQRRIHDVLAQIYSDLGPKTKLIVVAQSMGSHVISDYAWDSSRPNGATAGIWKGQAPKNEAKDGFLRLSTMVCLFTTGSNIPVFISGIPRGEIEAFTPQQRLFKWINYFDKDDILGYPLEDLSPSYRALVRDREINAGSGFKSATPFSHTEYWGDEKFLIDLAEEIWSNDPRY